MVTYRDQYVRRDELWTDVFTCQILDTFLHEISHMWFGNFVTMKWWDDLWLNESFATYVSHICLDEAPGLEKFTKAWSIFMGDSYWGLEEDQKSTTHPIAVDIKDTEGAIDLFDGISYGKGSCWLKQTFHLFGRQVFEKAVSAYFKEFAYSNTSLEDFIGHFSQAAKDLKIERDFTSWSDTWLKTAGLNEIWHDVEEENGKIKKFTV